MADGNAIEVEVWELTTQAFGSFVAAIPPPLGIGTVKLEDGTPVKGFICEQYATQVQKTSRVLADGVPSWLPSGNGHRRKQLLIGPPFALTPDEQGYGVILAQSLGRWTVFD